MKLSVISCSKEDKSKKYDHVTNAGVFPAAVGRRKSMEKLVWNKVREFLEVLRCEDIDRESIVETRELQEAKQILSDKNVVYQQSIANVRIEEQEKIKGYVNALREYSFEECQQAYVQGLVDCMLILSGVGILKPQKEVERLLKVFIQS